jgi:hypothetical protein
MGRAGLLTGKNKAARVGSTHKSLLLLAIHHKLSRMQDEQLKNIDSEDLDDALSQIETSFSIKFGTYELQHVMTFGELCNVVESKIGLVSVSDCTSQQAFYKLRAALAISAGTFTITPDSSLELLLPSHERKAIWRSVEQQIGFKVDVIGVSPVVAVTLFFAFLVSLAAFFISAKAAGICFLVSCFATSIANKIGNTLHAKTVRECVEKMTREQYVKSRRNPGTFNRREVFSRVQAIFVNGLGLPDSALHREATFV